MEPIPESREALEERDVVLEDDQLLERLSRVSVEVQNLVPDCIGMTVALLADDLVVTLVATDAEVAVLDAMQYVFDGPCVKSVREERVVELNGAELLDEEEWRLFARASAAAAVGSTLTMPLVTDGQVVGSVNLYAAAANAFGGQHQELADLLGAWAPGAVANADLSFETRRLAEDAPRRMRERARFETAIGLLAAREGLGLDEAQRHLVDAAERAGVSLARIAHAVIASYSQDST